MAQKATTTTNNDNNGDGHDISGDEGNRNGGPGFELSTLRPTLPQDHFQARHTMHPSIHPPTHQPTHRHNPETPIIILSHVLFLFFIILFGQLFFCWCVFCGRVMSWSRPSHTITIHLFITTTHTSDLYCIYNRVIGILGG